MGVLILISEQFWSSTSFGHICFKMLVALEFSFSFIVNIFRSAYLFWNKQATNVLKAINILLLMVQFHNDTLKFCELGLVGDRLWLSEPTACFRIIGKEIFHKIGPTVVPKRIGYKISMIF